METFLTAKTASNTDTESPYYGQSLYLNLWQPLVRRRPGVMHTVRAHRLRLAGARVSERGGSWDEPFLMYDETLDASLTFPSF